MEVSHQRTPTILIVDDNIQTLQLIGLILSQRIPCDLSFASSSREALEILEEITPDLILLDVKMPGMDGFEVCKILRAREATREIPIIFITGQHDTDSIVQGFDIGGNDYVCKPFASEELVARMRLHLNLKLRTDELKAAILRIKHLEGIISVCMYCKKIRDDNDSWQQMERYLMAHSDAVFSHGICPTCLQDHWNSPKK